VESLPAALESHGIGYEHMPALGGKRGRSRDVPEDTKRVLGRGGLPQLCRLRAGRRIPPRVGAVFLAIGDRERVAVMCAEAVWWRCHRRIIADYLLAVDRDVWHILSA
jgi:uncharacterized protein (DUF488 family)